jgi:serpin B
MDLKTPATVVFVASLLILVGSVCHFLPQPAPVAAGALVRADDSAATTAATEALADASNRFAFELFANLCNASGGGNLLFSPYSISAAFAMAFEGATGLTAEEMASVFHFPTDDQTRRSSFASLYNRLNIDNGGYSLHTANAVWPQRGYPILKEYIDTISNYYRGKVSAVDFAGATEQARRTINEWVSGQTNGKIKELFPPGSLGVSTELAITNAIYFKGSWMMKFDKSKTKPGEFKVSPNLTVTTPMMELQKKRGTFMQYAETDELEFLELPYEYGDATMLILLPKGNDIASFEASLTLEKIEGWKKKMRKEVDDVKLPRFSIHSDYDLKETLAGMGMPSAFYDKDFSKMNGHGGLWIDTAVHQAYIDVNEEGTKAAAATGIGMPAGISPEFIADHPFLFLIQDKATGAILFMGKVTDPTK